MIRFATQYDEVLSYELEKADNDSQTVPDASYSVQEIIKRFTRGTLSPDQLERPHFYDEISDNEIDNIPDRVTDITDYQDNIDRGVNILRDLENSASTANNDKIIDSPIEKDKEEIQDKS